MIVYKPKERIMKFSKEAIVDCLLERLTKGTIERIATSLETNHKSETDDMAGLALLDYERKRRDKLKFIETVLARHGIPMEGKNPESRINHRAFVEAATRAEINEYLNLSNLEYEAHDVYTSTLMHANINKE